MLPHFFDQTPDTLTTLFAEWGLPRFRARQVMEWVYRHGVADPQQMTNLSRSDRDLISRRMTFLRGQVIRHQHATDGTEKLLIDWGLERGLDRGPESGGPGSGGRGPDADSFPMQAYEQHVDAGNSQTDTRGLSAKIKLPLLASARTPDPDRRTPIPDPRRQTECVMIPAVSSVTARPRRTACISSQIGCPVGCKFCASGLGGLDGNLTPGQIIQQAWQLAHPPHPPHPPAPPHPSASPLKEADAEGGSATEAPGTPSKATPPKASRPSGGGITNVVFMGMGEPMANLRGVLPALRTLAADWGMNLSARRITVSTVGVPAGIRKLADLDLPVTLAISLHAPNDELRKQIIPWAEFVTIEQLLDAGRAYFQKTGREITLEYILLGGLNDQPDHARQLVALARQLRCNINLIRYNEVAGLPFLRPDDADVQQFQHLLRQAGINVHIRASRGRDIAAACGQLRHEATTG